MVLSRRTFLMCLGAVPLIAWKAACAPESGGEGAPSTCMEPLTAEEKTMASLADTIVPGGNSDPTGAPGALEACALSVMYDQTYPFYAFIPWITTLLDSNARKKYSIPFRSLTLDQRTEIVRESEAQLPLLTQALRFIRAAFYAAPINRVGWDYMGFPGENLGYKNSGFSFGRKMSEELTRNGYLP